MSDVERSKSRGQCQRSIHRVHFDLRRREDTMARPLAVRAFAQQVAGHRDSPAHYLGLLQCNNTVMKPILKEAQRREVDFYCRVSCATSAELQELRRCVPKYFGCRKFAYDGVELDYIVLEDLTERMLEPCVMDVKIGRRTWDPLASEEKIRKEQSKYAQCKQEFGFCIPGFQVYRVTTGKLQKYNKEYGKKLHGSMVRDAIRTYLNGEGGSVCRALVLQLLGQLWRVQRWARRQRAVRLYAASLLLLYDAARLRPAHSSSAPAPLGTTLAPPAPFSSLSPLACAPLSPLNPPPSSPLASHSPWADVLDKLNHNHSAEHNYEDKLSKIKMNYRAMLDQLSYESPTPNPWGTVKVIDFAHAYFNDEDEQEVDENFRDGLDNFVKIFESFLRETEDQII